MARTEVRTRITSLEDGGQLVTQSLTAYEVDNVNVHGYPRDLYITFDETLIVLSNEQAWKLASIMVAQLRKVESSAAISPDTYAAQRFVTADERGEHDI